MSASRDDEFASRLKQAMEGIPGVTSATVRLDGSAEVDEINLVGTFSRQPKQLDVVHDAVALLDSQFGIQVDYRKINLVQIGPEGECSHRMRLRLMAVGPHPTLHGQLQVLLRHEGQAYEGTAPLDPSAPREVGARAAAEATIQIIQEIARGVVTLTLRELQIIPIVGREVCLTLIAVTTRQGEGSMVGACLIGGDPLDAACKATLDAINRRLVVWTTIDLDSLA